MTLDEYLNTCFVDRDHEIGTFRRMLEGAGNRILVVGGESGIGKSTLMERMLQECQTWKRRTVKVVCRDNRNDALFMMRSIAEALGDSVFDEFADLDRRLTALFDVPFSVNINVNGDVSVLDGATIEGSALGDVSGVVVRDVHVDRGDVERTAREQLGRLSDLFIDALAVASKSESVVVFIDDVQKVAPEARRWIWDDLLFAVKDERLTDAHFVLLADRKPEPPEPTDWRFVAAHTDLQPLGLEHITLYLERRGIQSPERDYVAGMVFTQSLGKAAAMVNMVDGYLAWKKTQS